MLLPRWPPNCLRLLVLILLTDMLVIVDLIAFSSKVNVFVYEMMYAWIGSMGW